MNKKENKKLHFASNKYGTIAVQRNIGYSVKENSKKKTVRYETIGYITYFKGRPNSMDDLSERRSELNSKRQELYSKLYDDEVEKLKKAFYEKQGSHKFEFKLESKDKELIIKNCQKKVTEKYPFLKKSKTEKKSPIQDLTDRMSALSDDIYKFKPTNEKIAISEDEKKQIDNYVDLLNLEHQKEKEIFIKDTVYRMLFELSDIYKNIKFESLANEINSLINQEQKKIRKR